MKYVHEEGANIATRENDLLHFFKGLDEDEEIEVVKTEDEPSTTSKSAQTLLKWTPEIGMLALQFCLKEEDSYEARKIYGITDKASREYYKESTTKIPEEQGPSNVSPKFKKKSRIFVSDSEVSLLEINVNSPNFRDISMEANIPQQQRLIIWSPESGNEEESCELDSNILEEEELPDTSSISKEAEISAHSSSPPQVSFCK